MCLGPAGKCQVEVERRARTSQFFGQQDAGTREITTLGHFCKEIDQGNELAYLTTQALPEALSPLGIIFFVFVSVNPRGH